MLGRIGRMDAAAVQRAVLATVSGLVLASALSIGGASPADASGLSFTSGDTPSAKRCAENDYHCWRDIFGDIFDDIDKRR